MYFGSEHVWQAETLRDMAVPQLGIEKMTEKKKAGLDSVGIMAVEASVPAPFVALPMDLSVRGRGTETHGDTLMRAMSGFGGPRPASVAAYRLLMVFSKAAMTGDVFEITLPDILETSGLSDIDNEEELDDALAEALDILCTTGIVYETVDGEEVFFHGLLKQHLTHGAPPVTYTLSINAALGLMKWGSKHSDPTFMLVNQEAAASYTGANRHMAVHLQLEIESTFGALCRSANEDQSAVGYKTHQLLYEAAVGLPVVDRPGGGLEMKLDIEQLKDALSMLRDAGVIEDFDLEGDNVVVYMPAAYRTAYERLGTMAFKRIQALN